ncbi:winged helix-turn-helix transcriptional regulator [Tateyamaria sp. SN6-1]|uniref:winged helix-turn-helix transcriptional regulator n=1 Tax=Tateyamaria sp. SN6-1 TaxID=3092148 RepID=UPI0039F59D34
MTPPDTSRQSPVPLEHCGVARALEVVPDRWTWLILRQLMYGVGRFADIQAEIGIPKSVLSARLARMLENELASKQPYRDGFARTRHAYVLTRKGRALMPVLLALMHWGDAHMREGEPALSVTDRRDGTPLRVALTREENALPIRRLRYAPAGGD